MPETLLTWDALSTLAGASAVTYLIVAYTKRAVDRIWPPVLGTDLYAVLVSFFVLLTATAARGRPLTWDAVALAFLNGFLVAAASGKMADKTLTERERQLGTGPGRRSRMDGH